MVSCLSLIFITFLLFGYQGSNQKSEPQSFNIGLEKAQKIEVLSPEAADSVTTITDNHEINQFIEGMEVDDWELNAVPTEGVKGKKFNM